MQDAEAQGQLVNGTLRAAGEAQKAIDKDVASQVNDLGKQQAVVDGAIANDVNGQQKALNKTIDAVGKQQAAVDSTVAKDLNKQGKALNKTISDVGSVRSVLLPMPLHVPSSPLTCYRRLCRCCAEA